MSRTDEPYGQPVDMALAVPQPGRFTYTCGWCAEILLIEVSLLKVRAVRVVLRHWLSDCAESRS